MRHRLDRHRGQEPARGQRQFEDAYAKLEEGEVWLIGSDIPEYSMGNRLNHKPKRRRKLLLHRREVAKFADKASQRGFTLVRYACTSSVAERKLSWGWPAASNCTTSDRIGKRRKPSVNSPGHEQETRIVIRLYQLQ